MFHFSESPRLPAAPWAPGAARNHSAATRLSLGAYMWMVHGVVTKGQWNGEKGRETESRVDSVGTSFMLGTHLPVVELALALALALTLTLTLARCRQPGVQRQSVERDAASAKTSRRGRGRAKTSGRGSGSGGRMVVVESDGVSRRRGEHLGDIGRYGEM